MLLDFHLAPLACKVHQTTWVLLRVFDDLPCGVVGKCLQVSPGIVQVSGTGQALYIEPLYDCKSRSPVLRGLPGKRYRRRLAKLQHAAVIAVVVEQVSPVEANGIFPLSPRSNSDDHSGGLRC